MGKTFQVLPHPAVWEKITGLSNSDVLFCMVSLICQASHKSSLPTPPHHSQTHLRSTCLDLFHTPQSPPGFWPGGWLTFLFTAWPQPSFLMFYIVSMAVTFASLLTRVQIFLWPDNLWLFWVKECQISPDLQHPWSWLRPPQSIVLARLAFIWLG